jgi:hypothetical protein
VDRQHFDHKPLACACSRVSWTVAIPESPARTAATSVLTRPVGSGAVAHAPSARLPRAARPRWHTAARCWNRGLDRLGPVHRNRPPNHRVRCRKIRHVLEVSVLGAMRAGSYSQFWLGRSISDLLLDGRSSWMSDTKTIESGRTGRHRKDSCWCS